MGIEIEAGTRKFASGLLPELIAAVRRTGQGNLFTIIGSDPRLGEDLTTWCRFTRNTLVETTKQANHTRWVIRCGEAPAESEVDRPVGSRLWLYTNFDCNLRCDYCCVRSSPKASRRALGLERIKRIAKEAAELGVREIFVTGGEPFLLSNIDETLLACAAAVPTTVLTNGMLLVGRRLEMLRAMPRDRITLQISLDSPTPELHDRHRGKGTWARAMRGIENARSAGFRVRLAATVSTDADADAFQPVPGRPQCGGRRSSDPPHRATRLCKRRHCARARRSGTGDHHHRGRCLLAPGRSGGRRSFSITQHFSPSRSVQRCAARVRSRKGPRTSASEDIQLRITAVTLGPMA